MGASLSRPDPSSPASVAEAAFNTARRGYQPDEVRAFLVAVAAEMGRLHERERQLEAELRDAREVEQPAQLDDETITNLLGEETLRVLQTARESASQIKIRAEDTAARILREANDEANRLRQDADVEAARRRQDAASDAEAEVALAKQQGREMVNEARAYRERVLSDLERRTTLARQQIEELVHGRDRLLQVFERARLVAVDVTSELKAIDSPDELVNLTPTTGPVPIMVPTERRPGRPSDDDTASDSTSGEDATGGETAETDEIGDQEAGADDSTDDAVAVAADVDGSTDDAVAVAAGADDSTDEAVAVAADVDGSTDDAVAVTADVDDSADGSDRDPATGASSDADGHLDREGTDDRADADVGIIDADIAHEDDADEQGDEESDEGVPTAAERSDTNVVALFRGRPAPSEVAEADAHPSTDSDDDTVAAAGGSDPTAERPDVGGIFERLRQAVPDTETSTPAAPDPEPVDDIGAGGDTASDAFTRRDEALVPLIVAGARRVKRVLADEQNEALDSLRQGDAVTELDDLVPTADDHVGAFLVALDDELQSAAAAGAGELAVNDTKTLRKKIVKAGALTNAEHHVRSSLVGPLRDRLERAIADGTGDNDDIAKRVRAVYREWKTQHIDDQLDDVFRSAYSGGMHAAAKEGSRVVWTNDPRLAPCPDCEDNALAGAVVVGDEFPTGHLTTPAHPGCTCLALPVD